MTEPTQDIRANGTRPIVRGTRGVVASTHYLASVAGLRILEQGGNAFDAAAATGFCLAVLMPHMNGLGGECPALLYRADTGRPAAVNGQGESPRSATLENYRALGLRLIPGDGWLPFTAPATVGTYLAILGGFGSMSLADVVAPALHLADTGFPMYASLRNALGTHAARFLDEWPSSAAVYLPDGREPGLGEPYRMPDWAATVEGLVRAERDAGDRSREEKIDAARRWFYTGRPARAMVEFARSFPVRDSTGTPRCAEIEPDDIARHTPRVEDPWTAPFRGITVAKCGPWTQGPVFLQQLLMLERSGWDGLPEESAASWHMQIEVSKLAFADREFFYGDPLHSTVDAGWILSPARAEKRVRLIDPRHASHDFRPDGHDPMRVAGVLDYPPAEPANPAGASTHANDTVHLDVADADGNLASLTPSGGWFSSSPVVPGVGFPLGTRGQMFLLKPGYPNTLAPGKRPRGTLTPSIALFPDGSAMAFGTPGGDGQDQWTFQFFLRHAVHDMDLQRAIDEPTCMSRHVPSSFYPRSAFPARVTFESRVPTETVDQLREMGHDVDMTGPWAHGMVTAARWTPGGKVEAAASSRKETAYAVAW